MKVSERPWIASTKAACGGLLARLQVADDEDAPAVTVEADVPALPRLHEEEAAYDRRVGAARAFGLDEELRRGNDHRGLGRSRFRRRADRRGIRARTGRPAHVDPDGGEVVPAVRLDAVGGGALAVRAEPALAGTRARYAGVADCRRGSGLSQTRRHGPRGRMGKAAPVGSGFRRQQYQRGPTHRTRRSEVRAGTVFRLFPGRSVTRRKRTRGRSVSSKGA